MAQRSHSQLHFNSVQSLSHVRLFVTPWTASHQASLSIINSRSLLNSCPLSWWCHPTISSSVIPFSSSLPSFPASGSFQISQLFSSDGWSIGNFRFNISPSNEYSGLISFWMDWLYLLAVQGTLKRLSNTTVQKHQFFSHQPSIRSNSHIHTWLWEKAKLWLCTPLSVKWCLCFLICCLGLSWHSFQGVSTF